MVKKLTGDIMLTNIEIVLTEQELNKAIVDYINNNHDLFFNINGKIELINGSSREKPLFTEIAVPLKLCR